jgi:hypothetical protein
MKKTIYTLMMFLLGIHLIHAKPVTPVSAKNLAISFYKQNSLKVPSTVTLAHTETSSNGEALYYVFNINENDGFVIITADDAAHPIIGYSTERQFKVPEAYTNFNFWMKNRKQEIIALKAANIVATEDIASEWKGDFSANKTSQRTNGTNSVNTATTVVVGPLVQSDWNQSPYYNAYCPGSTGNGNNSAAAVTGCVATTMAQIMRYWSYPAKGKGSSTYTQSSNTNNYPAQTANYGATTYNWAGMPLNNTNITSTASTYSAVATLMYQCGVSVDMTYAPSGSGAFVLAVDGGGGPSAQTSYTNYFGYNASTIKGYQRTQGSYSDAAWLALIETDLNAHRPVQYAGQDPSEGGHTWVCDGYESNDYVHMNWGWAGDDNGYFSINNLQTTNGTFNPSTNHEILVGIQPPSSVDAGIASVNAPGGTSCALTYTPTVTIENFGVNTLTTSVISYKIDAGTSQSYTWTGSLATGQTANVSLHAFTTTVGTHTITSATSNPNSSTDANTANDQSASTFVVNATVMGTIPLAEGFEGTTTLPSGWSLYSPAKDVTWQVVTNVAHTGTNCIGINNCGGDTNTDMTGRTYWFRTASYDFSSATTASMSFDVGYVPANDGTKTYTDTLAVYYSVDCGSTWTQVYNKGGIALSTAPVFTISSTVNCTNPTASQWRTDVTDLSAIKGQSNVMFGFKNISDWGNWLYLDNINLTTTSGTTGISSHNSSEGINVYPNPAHTNLFVSLTENTSSVSVTDIIGQTVITEQRVNGNQEQAHAIDISNLADGIYFVRVNSTNSNPTIIRFIKN